MTRKRRTRKQKQKAKIRRPANTPSGTKKTSSASDVKSQFKYNADKVLPIKLKTKKAYSSEKTSDLASIKKDLIKSLSLATLMFVAELVIYLFW